MYLLYLFNTKKEDWKVSNMSHSNESVLNTEKDQFWDKFG